MMPTPKIEYGRGSKQAVFQPREGKWDLRDKKFIALPKTPLQSWGVMVFNNPRTVSEAQVKTFIQQFIQTYSGHGGSVQAKVRPTELPRAP